MYRFLLITKLNPTIITATKIGYIAKPNTPNNTERINGKKFIIVKNNNRKLTIDKLKPNFTLVDSFLVLSPIFLLVYVCNLTYLQHIYLIIANHYKKDKQI